MTSQNGTPEASSRGLPRALVWALLVIALAANACVSLFSLPIALGVVSGVVALVLGVLLVRDHLRRRAS